MICDFCGIKFDYSVSLPHVEPLPPRLLRIELCDSCASEQRKRRNEYLDSIANTPQDKCADYYLNLVASGLSTTQARQQAMATYYPEERMKEIEDAENKLKIATQMHEMGLLK